jgi:hypothetical protein
MARNNHADSGLSPIELTGETHKILQPREPLGV